ncbi:hypothetical protein LL946_14135 [Knoellia locipacati]|uniref:membrane protein YczE n=1 Tax=Knoellia locipacati TaxID=882824 RepID=UPI003850B418
MSPIQTLRTGVSRGASRRVDLVPMTPMEQLRAGHTGRRVAQLVVGLWLYGTAMAMFIRAELGLDPWDVFHYGVQQHVGWSFGTIVIVVGGLVLLLWIPLRQWPALGTVMNVFVIGIATDVMLAVLETPTAPWLRWAFLLGGIVVNGIGGAMYIGSQYGPGPRDGLMTGLARRTGLSIRLIRTALEVSVLVAGWLLGGVVGVGTVLYALLIGPAVQAFLPLVTVRVERPARPAHQAGDGSAVDGQGEREHALDPRSAELATCDGERPA